ncbi:MAG: Gfo/Idh/MocA family oxidoreductase [Candidatus Latescibacterota bacterium]
MDKVRLGIIGCGGIARAHLDGYRLLRQRGCDCWEITALCDLVDSRTADFAAQIEGLQGTVPRRYETVAELLAAGGVDGVDVCTLHADHHVTCVQCLEAGVHVLVEKPLGVTVRAARRIQEAAARTGRILSVAENSRRGLGQRAITWLFHQDRRLGAPRMFAIERLHGPSLPLAAPPEPEPVDALAWRSDRLLSGGGWTYDFGGGFIDSQARVFTADGKAITSRDLELDYLLSLSCEERERLFPHGVQRSLAIECHEFVDCIRQGRRPEVDAEAGLAGLAVSAALYESAVCGQAVRVDDVLCSRIDAYQRPIDEHWGLV